MSAARRIARAFGVLVLALCAWTLYVGWLAVDEGAMPSRSSLPAVPAGAEHLTTTQGCGSGGCWRELRFRPAPGTEPDRVVSVLGLDREQCRRDSWPDPRATCTGASVGQDGIVVVHARYDW